MEISRVQFRDGCLLGATSAIVGRGDIQSIEPGNLGDMRGIVVTIVGGETRFIPESNIKDVVISEREKASAPARKR